MQHKPEEVERQSERLQPNNQAQHSYKPAEQEEHIQAAQGEKSAAPGEALKWPDHEHPVANGDSPPGY